MSESDEQARKEISEQNEDMLERIYNEFAKGEALFNDFKERSGSHTKEDELLERITDINNDVIEKEGIIQSLDQKIASLNGEINIANEVIENVKPNQNQKQGTNPALIKTITENTFVLRTQKPIT